MRRISTWFVPRLLSDDQKAHRVSVCRELKQQARDDPNFIYNIITGDETWVYGYDPDTKQQSSQWKSPNSPRPRKARQVRSDVKSMLIFFSTSKALPTRNSYPLVRPSMASFTVWFWSSWGRTFGANLQTSGRKTIGFYTITKLPLTHHSLFDNPWRPKTLQWFLTPVFAWPHTLRFFPIPQHEITAEGASFWHDWGDPRRIARGYQHTHILELPEMHEIMRNALGSLYTCSRGLLRRRRWKLGVTVRSFFMVKFPEFLGSTSYLIILRQKGPVIHTPDTGTDIEKTAPLTNIAWSYT